MCSLKLLAAPGAAAALVLKDGNNKTPFKVAIMNGRTACEAALRAAGAEYKDD